MTHIKVGDFVTIKENAGCGCDECRFAKENPVEVIEVVHKGKTVRLQFCVITALVPHS